MAYNRILEIETRWFNRLCARAHVLTTFWLLLFEVGGGA